MRYMSYLSYVFNINLIHLLENIKLIHRQGETNYRHKLIVE